MQLQLHLQDLGCQNESRGNFQLFLNLYLSSIFFFIFIAISGMFRGVPLHPQHPGHESIAHHP